jgi:hypothetical protein
MLRLLEYEAAVHEYDYLGARVDVLVDQAIEARERGDQARAARLVAEARQLVEGPYWRAGQRVSRLADTEAPWARCPQQSLSRCSMHLSATL